MWTWGAVFSLQCPSIAWHFLYHIIFSFKKLCCEFDLYVWNLQVLHVFGIQLGICRSSLCLGVVLLGTLGSSQSQKKLDELCVLWDGLDPRQGVFDLLPHCYNSLDKLLGKMDAQVLTSTVYHLYFLAFQSTWLCRVKCNFHLYWEWFCHFIVSFDQF